MTLTEQLNARLKQIEALTASPNYLSPDEKKPKETDTLLIKQLKKGLKPETAEKETQTTLTHEKLKEMDETEKSINKFLWSTNFIKNEDTIKSVSYKLELIERGIDNLREDLKHSETNGQKLSEGMKELEQKLKAGQLTESGLSNEVNRLAELLKKKESDFEIQISTKDEEWEQLNIKFDEVEQKARDEKALSETEIRNLRLEMTDLENADKDNQSLIKTLRESNEKIKTNKKKYKAVMKDLTQKLKDVLAQQDSYGKPYGWESWKGDMNKLGEELYNYQNDYLELLDMINYYRRGILTLTGIPKHNYWMFIGRNRGLSDKQIWERVNEIRQKVINRHSSIDKIYFFSQFYKEDGSDETDTINIYKVYSCDNQYTLFFKNFKNPIKLILSTNKKGNCGSIQTGQEVNLKQMEVLKSEKDGSFDYRKFKPYYIGDVPSNFKIEKDTILNLGEEVNNGDIKEIYGINISYDTNPPKGKDGWWRMKEAMEKQWEEKGIDPKKVIRMG